MDAVLLVINVRHCQPTEFRNTKSCVQQDVHALVVSTVMGMFMNEDEELFFLIRTQSNSLLCIVMNDLPQGKCKWFFADQIIVHCHLIRRFKNTSNVTNGAVTLSILLLQLDQPELHFIDTFLAEGFLAYEIQCCPVSCFGGFFTLVLVATYRSASSITVRSPPKSNSPFASLKQISSSFSRRALSFFKALSGYRSVFSRRLL